MSKQDIFKTVDELKDLCVDACRKIWENPELSGEENFGSEYYSELLRKEGFRLVVNEHVPHAFIAEWGSGHPVLAILGEYDALPGFSQKASCVREEVTEGGAGHACGHNLLGAAAATGAIALKRVLEADGLEGTVRFYGCPEEETLCGKVKMIHYNMFDGCDFAFSWHPMSVNMAFDTSYLANASFKFYYTGLSSHAGFAPQNGRSALDAMELTNVGVQYLREHVIDGTRIHYTTDSCGYAPNIVHPDAKSWYYVRAPHMSDVKETMERVKKCAQGAAIMTETQVRFELLSGCSEMLINNAFADLTYKNLVEMEPISYTAEEREFARKIQDTVAMETCARERRAYNCDGPMFETIALRDQWTRTPMKASTDSGDVSMIMPMNLFTAAAWPLGVAPHTWQAAACAGTSLGEKAAVWAAKALAATAYDVLTMPEEREKIKAEFESRRDDKYIPMI
ncbi:MAG: amidohydrolase [Mogibacterium sp.]|nr:amidohydrolase [Mogibacterium sp.]